MKPDGGPAFPREDYQTNGRPDKPMGQQGMSLRDYFAGQALVECIRVAADQTPDTPPPMLGDLMLKAAAYAYFAADAMLAEREKS